MADHATITSEIENCYRSFKTARKYMAENLEAMRDIEEEIKTSDEHYEEWATAKNNDVRHIMMLRWINDDPDIAERYYKARASYREWKSTMRERAIEAEGLKVQVAALGAFAPLMNSPQYWAANQ